jgi:hypothetical protein
MRKVSVILAVLAFAASAAWSQAASTDIKVFAVNLGTSAVDVQLGNPGAVFQATALPANSASRMVRVGKPGSYQVYYKYAAGKVQLTPRNQGGQPLLYTLAAGKSYLIRLAGDNNVELFEISDPAKASPVKPDLQSAKVCFVNGTPNSVPALQVGSGLNSNTLVSLKDLPSREFSNFASVNYPGDYGCFWILPNAKDALTGYLDASGKPIMTSFAEGTYWALVLWQDSKGNVAGNLVNITPDAR